MPEIDLSDLSLFGNDAAEDEAEDVFNSYILDRDELAEFLDPTKGLVIARAYKGEGKSAVLRICESRLAEHQDLICLSLSATATVPALPNADFALWVRNWKEALLDRLCNEIGTRIGLAWKDDAMALVQEAEKTGFKERNLVGSILRRIPGIQIAGGSVSLDLSNAGGPGVANSEQTVKRWLDGQPPVWLLVDDVDLNFQNQLLDKTKVAAFFVACREMINSIPQLRVRAAIRPNIWTTIKLEFEALSHVEQYNVDLRWTEDQIRDLLARRIEGYLRRTDQWDYEAKKLPVSPWERSKRLLSFVFEDPMRWGSGVRPPHVVLYTMSKHRPRWVVELCKVAAEHASPRRQITLDDILPQLEAFGRRRIEDTIAEFRSQCPEVGELVDGFVDEAEEYDTGELFKLIDRKILSHLNPTIVGVPGKVRARDVAAFLFQIGVVFAREDLPGDAYRHYSYAERPSLLDSRARTDAGFRWEVHPVYRQALGMRDERGKERSRARR